MRIGRYEVAALETGTFALDGGAMFGVVPKVLWEQQLPADAKNRVRLAARALLLQEVPFDTGTGSASPARPANAASESITTSTASERSAASPANTAIEPSAVSAASAAREPGRPRLRRILVDTGMGERWDARAAERYGIDATPTLQASLRRHGLGSDDVTDVLLTHLHFDHAGGATRTAVGGAGAGCDVVPAFPNARYWVQRRHLAWARRPSEKDRGSYRTADFEALAADGMLEQLDGGGSWAPGIELQVCDGHCAGMQVVHVQGPQGRIACAADLVPTAAHVPLAWIPSYDNEPLRSLHEKRELLQATAAQDGLLFLVHDPDAAAVRVVRTARGFAAGARIAL